MGFRVFALLLFGLLVAYYFPFWIGISSFYQSDLTYYFEPFSHFICEGLRAGRLPLWNPYLYCGMAQAAVPSPGIFYPGTLLFLIGKFSQSVAAYLMLHQLLAGCGAYLLVASLGWGVLAASVAGLTVALSGYMFALTANYTLVATIAWLPLLLFFIRSTDRTWTRVNLLRVFGASACMFCMISTGRAETFVPASLLVASYVAITALVSYRDDRMLHPALMQAAMRALSVAGGCLLALPVILPAVEWVKLSPRSGGLELQWVLMWSANWYDCLCLIAAQPLGDITILGSRFLNLVASRPNALPYLTSTYVGPVIFTLALWSLFDRNWRWRWVVLAFLLSGLVMSLGSYTPVAPFICGLSPAFAAFRYPVKLIIFPILALAFMAARGASAAVEREVPKRAQMVTAGFWALIGLIGLVLMASPQLSQLTAIYPWFSGKVIDFSVMKEAQSMFGKSLLITAALGLLVSGNYLAYRLDQFTRPVFAFLTGGTLILTLLLPSIAFQRHGAPGDFYQREHPLVARLHELTKGRAGQLYGVRAQSLFHDPLTLTHEFMNRQKMGFQQAFYLYSREVVLPNTNVDWHIPYSFGYEAAEDGFYKKLNMDAMVPSGQNLKRSEGTPVSEAPLARFCQITSTQYCITQRVHTEEKVPLLELDPSLFTKIEDNADLNCRIYRARVILPRAYFAQSIVWSADREQFRNDVLKTQDKNMLYQTYLRDAAPANPGGIADGAPTDCTVSFVSESHERVKLHAHCDTTRLLVLTDHFYPGWNATIDGKHADIHLVNFFARGVIVPPGDHEIEYVYMPWSVYVGLIGAAIVLLVFIAAILLAP